MENNLKKDFILEGLCCANCGAKIERAVNDLKEVKYASLNFMTKKLKVEINDSEDINNVLPQIIKIVKKIEPDVKVLLEENTSKSENHSCCSHGENVCRCEEGENHSHEHSHSHEHGGGDDKKKIIKIGIGTIIFAIGMIFKLPYSYEIPMFIISYILIGGDVVLKAFKNIIRGQIFDENFLMGIATIGAFSIKQFPEGVAVMLFYQVGEMFQELAVDKSRKSISELMDIRPDYANLRKNGNIEKVSPETIKIGDTIVIKPGEKVPLDGKIVEGSSTVDTSALTGESIPRDVNVNDEILSGFVNKNGLLTVQVTKEFKESTVSKILDLVQNASGRKAETEKFITKFARYYTPIVVISALLIAIIPPIIIKDALFSQWLYRALVFLVVSCPCALVISIPLSFFGGIGGASKNGVLIKGGNYLEALNNVESIVFDKTGTLTKGVFKVTKINTNGSITEENLIEIAAFAESNSSHPIANSILKYYGREVDQSEIENYEEISGHGTKVKVKGKDILVGNSKLMNKENINYQQVEDVGTIIYIAIDNIYSGSIIISDEIKDDCKGAIKDIKDVGVKKTIMLTGDSKKVATKVSQELGIDEFYAELLPNEKVEKLEEIDNRKSTKGNIIFVGDGINDAPVLARADVGIAMGGLGSDAAIEAADIVIMTDEPSKIPVAIKIAKKTKAIVWQNIIFALGVKGIVLVLGALGLANMWEAVFADVGVALIAVLNAMRALKIQK